MKRLAVSLSLLLGLLTMAPAHEDETRPPAVGDPAPHFRLNDHEGNAVSVGGKTDAWTVVAFYPKALTPG